MCLAWGDRALENKIHTLTNTPPDSPLYSDSFGGGSPVGTIPRLTGSSSEAFNSHLQVLLSPRGIHFRSKRPVFLRPHDASQVLPSKGPCYRSSVLVGVPGLALAGPRVISQGSRHSCGPSAGCRVAKARVDRSPSFLPPTSIS